MIEFHASNTPACQSVAIMLEMCELEYRIRLVDPADAKAPTIIDADATPALELSGRDEILRHLARDVAMFEIPEESSKAQTNECLSLLATNFSACVSRLDTQLASETFVAGSDITIADIALAPAIISTASSDAADDLPASVSSWIDRLQKRPAFGRGLFAIG